MLDELILFIMTFLLIYIIYELFLVRKAKKDKRRKKPVEVNYLIGKYNLDINKLNYKRLLNIISAVSAFDISLVVTIVSLLDSFYLQLLIGFVLIMLLILVSYDIVGRIYKKKGCCKNGKNWENRKEMARLLVK